MDQKSLKPKDEYSKKDLILASEYSTTKLEELTKKLRNKTSELEVYKTKYSKLQEDFETLLKIQSAEGAKVDETPKVKEKPPDPDETKRLQDKLSHTTNKLLETKNANLQLKNELKLANRLLQQEIGDDFETLSSNCNSNWRGRAQIICDLQQKNNELREKVKSSQGGNEAASPVKNDKKLEAITRENEELKRGLDESKKRLEAIKARNKALETEKSVLKTKLGESSERNLQTINELTVKLSSQQESKSIILNQKEKMIEKLKKDYDLVKVELEKQKCIIQNQMGEIEKKNGEIEVLHKKMRASRPPSAYQAKKEATNEDENQQMKRLETERLKLLDLMEIQNERLQTERDNHAKTQSHLRFERHRGAKLEANMARMELEHAKPSYRTNATVSRKSDVEDLKNQLELAEENIKALSKRLEIIEFEKKTDMQEFAKILRDCWN